METFSINNKPTLCELVKCSQKYGINGSHGSWEEYIKKLHPDQSPAVGQVDIEVLEGFLKSLYDEHDSEAETQGNTQGPSKGEVFVKNFMHVRMSRTRVVNELQSSMRLLMTQLVERGFDGRAMFFPPWVDAPASGVDRDRDPLTPDAPKPRLQNSAWSLVARTMLHPRYREDYNLPSFLPQWTRSSSVLPALPSGPPGPDDSASRGTVPTPRPPPRLLGIDCEMCRTEALDKALLSLCVVDEWGQVLYCRLVVPPGGRVVDFRTELTGVSPSDLEGVTLTPAGAVQDLVTIINLARRGRLVPPFQLPSDGGAEVEAPAPGDVEHPVVLVGHSLFNDLQAMQLDHLPVIDTSYLFAYRGLPKLVPSLQLLAAQVLGERIRIEGAAHDVAQDAAIAVRLAMLELQRAGCSSQLDPPRVVVSEQDRRCLFLISIPAGAAAELVRDEVLKAHAPMFVRVDGEVVGGGRAKLVFQSPEQARAAFFSLAKSSGVPQPQYGNFRTGSAGKSYGAVGEQPRQQLVGKDVMGRPMAEIRLAGIKWTLKVVLLDSPRAERLERNGNNSASDSARGNREGTREGSEEGGGPYVPHRGEGRGRGARGGPLGRVPPARVNDDIGERAGSGRMLNLTGGSGGSNHNQNHMHNNNHSHSHSHSHGHSHSHSHSHGHSHGHGHSQNLSFRGEYAPPAAPTVVKGQTDYVPPAPPAARGRGGRGGGRGFVEYVRGPRLSDEIVARPPPFPGAGLVPDVPFHHGGRVGGRGVWAGRGGDGAPRPVYMSRRDDRFG